MIQLQCVVCTQITTSSQKNEAVLEGGCRQNLTTDGLCESPAVEQCDEKSWMKKICSRVGPGSEAVK